MAAIMRMVTLIILCFISPLASAQNASSAKQFSTCMDKSGGVTVNMLDCISEDAKRQDVRLNKAYKDVMTLLSPSRKKQLQDAQRAWIKYRDANCTFYADPDGGTNATVNSNDCFRSATETRAQELENFKE